jgi:hypothetical protein
MSDMRIGELIASLQRILDGFDGVPAGEVSDLPLRLALEEVSAYLGGKVQVLAQRIEEAYCQRKYPPATGVPESIFPRKPES